MMAKIFKFDASRRKGGSTDSEQFNQSRGHSGGLGRDAERFARSSIRGVGRTSVYAAALMASLACYSLVHSFVSDKTPGWFLVIGMFAFTLLIWFVLERGFGIYLWRRPPYRRSRRRWFKQAPRRE